MKLKEIVQQASINAWMGYFYDKLNNHQINKEIKGFEFKTIPAINPYVHSVDFSNVVLYIRDNKGMNHQVLFSKAGYQMYIHLPGCEPSAHNDISVVIKNILKLK